MHGYHAVVVGAGIAGSTAAILMGRAGLRVALIERRGDPDAYKVLCTHYIQASATPTIRRLGLDGAIEEAGGLRNGAYVWCRWGWIVPSDDAPFGYNIRREKLDPMLRRLAAETPGVDLRIGERVTELLRSDGAVEGVRTRSVAGEEREVRARLVVGADGHRSTVAGLAGVEDRVRPNERLVFFAHYAGVSLATGSRSQMWMLEPDVAYTFPNDDGITLLTAMPSKQELPKFKEDPEAALLELHRRLPDGPDLAGAERVSKTIGTIDYPLIDRPAVPAPGLALAGDARVTSDPLWGVGCGWAFQTAEWLADAVAPALADDRPLGPALGRYRRRCRALAGHHFLIADFARARPLSSLERLMFSAAVRDEWAARHFEAFGSRRIPVRRFLSPWALARAAAVNVRHAVGRRGPAESPRHAARGDGAGGGGARNGGR